MKVLVTGANGFVGKNLQEALGRVKDCEIVKYDIENKIEELDGYMAEIDFIFHLAGVDRPEKVEEFYSGNRDLTDAIISAVKKTGKQIPILITSSIQAERDNDYGKSKLAGEQVIRNYREQTGSPIYIYRLPNVFGKWCRPNYNSVVATWCYNTANDLPIQVNDRNAKINFVYIDDVVKSFIGNLLEENYKYEEFFYVPTTYDATLGEIEDLLKRFKENGKTLEIPQVGAGFARALYSTYLSYLPRNAFSYELLEHRDDRGAFVEILKTVDSGQFSISTSKPGVTRGNHYHNTKNEKFLVLKGEAVIRFRHIFEKEIIEYHVSEKKLEVVDIPVGYTHNITNTGDTEMVLVLWANEQFDRENPDTYFLEV